MRADQAPDANEQWREPEGAFVEIPDPLMEPPTVRIYMENSDDARFVDGERYTADWIHKYNRLTQRPAAPIPWPEPVSGKPRSIRILTDFRPFEAAVIGYDSVDAASGEPAGAEAGARYECGRFGPESCVYPHPDGHVEIVGVPSEILEMPYLIVFAIWPISHFARGDRPDDPTITSASWLFRFSQK